MNTRKPEGFNILLPTWNEYPAPDIHQRLFMSKFGLAVIVGDEFHDDNWWRHISYSRKSKLPTYKDSKHIKEVFVGKDNKAIAIFPPEKEHINIHSNCLHLWQPLNYDPLPDFRRTIEFQGKTFIGI